MYAAMKPFSPDAPVRNVVRWSVSIPADMLTRIKREAASRGMSQSRFVSDAIQYALDHMAALNHTAEPKAHSAKALAREKGE